MADNNPFDDRSSNGGSHRSGTLGVLQTDSGTTSSSFSNVTPTTPFTTQPHSTQNSPGQLGGRVIDIKIGSARIGNELVKPLTYFAISVVITPTIPPASVRAAPVTSSDVDPWPKHNHDPTQVDRRYSEFVEMRKFLTYYFPWLVIPPLPAKSNSETMQTFLANPDSLTKQHNNLQRFVVEVRCMPEILQATVFYKFCTLPRESHDFIDMMDRLRQLNQTFDSEHGVVTGVSAAPGVTEAAKMVKSLTNVVSGWFASGGVSGSPRHIPQDIDSQVGAKLKTTVAYQHWLEEQEKLLKLKEACSLAFGPLSSFVQKEQETMEQYSELCLKMRDFSTDLKSSEAFGTLGLEFEEASMLFRIIANDKKDEVNRDDLGLSQALEHEMNWLQAAHETCDLFMRVLRQDAQRSILEHRPACIDRPLPAEYVPPGGTDARMELRIERVVILNQCLKDSMRRFMTSHRERVLVLFQRKARHALRYLSKQLALFVDEKNSFPLLFGHSSESQNQSALSSWQLVEEDNRSEEEIERKEEALAYFREQQEICKIDAAKRGVESIHSVDSAGSM